MASAPIPETKTLNTDKLPYWSWKDDDFIAQGKFSWLAFGEIFAAMVFYYWVASISPWPWVIVLSFMIAPLLLLRSERSILRGQELLLIYHIQLKLSLQMKWIIALTSLTCGFILFFCLAQFWLFGNSGWSFFLRSTVIGVISIVGACTSAMAISIAGAGPRATLKAIPFKIEKARFHALSLLFMPGFVIGLCIKTWEIRLLATLANLRAGFSAFSNNWTEAVLVSDIRHTPALLPGADKVDDFYVVSKLLTGFYRDNLVKTVRLITAFSYFFIALIYRWNIKASAFIWGPIALGLSQTVWPHDPKYPDAKPVAPRTDSTTWTTQIALGLLGLFCTYLLCWIALSGYLELYEDIRTALPDWLKIAYKYLAIPQFGVRFLIASIFLICISWFVWTAYKMSADYDEPLKNPEAYRNLSEQEFDGFLKAAEQVSRWRKITQMMAILTVYAFVLPLAVNYWSQANAFNFLRPISNWL